jgi:hypothetical protein
MSFYEDDMLRFRLISVPFFMYLQHRAHFRVWFCFLNIHLSQVLKKKKWGGEH